MTNKKSNNNNKDKDSKQNVNDNEVVTHVYLKDEEHMWVPALQLKVFQQDGKRKATVCRPLYKEEQDMMHTGKRGGKMRFSNNEVVDLSNYDNEVLPLQNVDSQGRLEDYKDMVQLPYMNEASILYNLKNRHVNGKPYTRTGDIVIAVNPYQWLNDLYTEQKRSYYSNRMVWEYTGKEEDPRNTMEPHVYEVSALAYKGLTMEGEDQSILVSGESGAGKTETVKICLNHIATTQRGPYSSTSDSDLNPTVQRIVESNPLLEAFGNAKTRRNDNSSRFGKYLQLQFEKPRNDSLAATTKHCALVGSRCEVYLLEKNRVVQHEASKERNFHIFYQLLAAPESFKAKYWSGLENTDAESFAYVGPTTTNSIEGLSDAEHLQKTLHALQLVGITGDKLTGLVQALCAVLALGNLGFKPDKDDSDKSKIATKTELKELAELIGVRDKDLKLALTERTMRTRGEVLKVPLTAEGAKEACDAFAKEIYQKIFLWLVGQINEATAAAPAAAPHKLGIIGLLDIFGFEAFQRNRFEQLCINYANEKLQQKFTEDVFRNVQIEYCAQGIPFHEIVYDDNTDVLDLIESPTGLLNMLNEECLMPKGNDEAFVQKALQRNEKSPCLFIHRTDRLSFGIQHYAGAVMYDAEQFVTKNLDLLPTDLQECAEKSTNFIISQSRSEPMGSSQQQQQGVAWGTAPVSPKPPQRQMVYGGRVLSPTGRSKQPALSVASMAIRNPESNLVAPTVWTKYKNQLSALMTDLRKTRSRYIRCIKPNSKKEPILMEHAGVVEQLRSAGVVAGIKISRSTFPNQLDNMVVLSRYGYKWDKTNYPSRKSDTMSLEEQRMADCEACMECLLAEKEELVACKKTGQKKMVKAFCVGKTKTYFRAGALEWLEQDRLEGLDCHATIIQKAARGWLSRNKEQSFERELKLRRAEEDRQRKAERDEWEARLEHERKERQAIAKKEQTALLAKVEEMKQKIKREDEEKERAERLARDRVDKARKEIAELKKRIEEVHEKEIMEKQSILAAQKKKLDENKKLIDFLKKENKKCRKDHDRVKITWDNLHENMKALKEGTDEYSEQCDGLNETKEKLQERNDWLRAEWEANKKLNKEMKGKVMAAQDKYMGMAETRLELQRTMARILSLVQDRSKNADIIEDTVVIALECESEARSVMAALETQLGEGVPDVIISDHSESSAGSESFWHYH